MKKIKKAYLLGTWFFGILCGFGHLALELFGAKPPETVNAMREMIVILPGKETNIFDITFGISIIMGFLLLAYGLLNLIILKSLDSQVLLKKLVYFNLVIVFIAFLLVVKYLFIVPIIFTGLALLSFLRATFLVKILYKK